jgi:TolB-like protein/tRNA A-37 threonylcarbamoyl transferase component Bud32
MMPAYNAAGRRLAAAPPPQASFGDRFVEAGTTLKHYRILSSLGEGGMGAVYRAEDMRLGRQVALKVLRPDLTVNRERLQRLEGEARAASAISHPGVATLYDIHHEGETVFLAMEYVEGKNLRQLLDAGPLPLPQLLDCLVQVSEALGAAHRKGIVHRDLKPENVMAADSGFYKILDFGLARMTLPENSGGDPLSELTQMLTVSRNLTSEGQVSGTVAYMSPEQIQGETVDARSDIFSFGILLYELATGTSPFKGKNLLATYHAIVHEEPPPIASLRPGAPQELNRIASRCLAKDPGGRYQTTADLVLDLRELKRERDSGSWRQSARTAGPGAGAARRPFLRARNVWIVAGGAALIFVSLYLYRPRGPELPSGAALVPAEASRATPAGGAPGAIPGADSASFTAGRTRIAVTPFANRSGDAGADWLSQGLPEMLTTDLARVPGLQVISSQRLQDLLQAAGRGEVKDLDRGAATQLGRYAGAGVVVNGSIFKEGGSYRIDVQAYDTATGEVLTAHRAEGTDIFKIADDLGSGLKKGLQMGAPGKGAPPLVATSSPEAYRLFTQGLKLYQGLRFPEAAEAFRGSLRIDPEFASSQLRLGMSLLLSGKAEEGIGWIRRAAGQADRLPERERALAAAIQEAFSPGEGGKKMVFIQELSDRYPRDPESLFWRAEALSGREGGRFEAIRILHQALDQNPNDALAVTSLARRLEELGLKQDAQVILQDFQKRNSAPPGGVQPPAAPLPPPSRP